MNLLKEAENNSSRFLNERPALKETQPVTVLSSLLLEEVEEFIAELPGGDRGKILDEFTDIVNYVAQIKATLLDKYGITEQELVDRSRYKYEIRNEHKYPAEDYQEGNSSEIRQRHVLAWAFLQAYGNTPEQKLGGEYY